MTLGSWIKAVAQSSTRDWLRLALNSPTDIDSIEPCKLINKKQTFLLQNKDELILTFELQNGEH